MLAVAYRDVPERGAYGRDDECQLTLAGYVAFLDPPKETAQPALEALKKHGVAVKVLTGDNELVTRKICQHVGLTTDTGDRPRPRHRDNVAGTIGRCRRADDDFRAPLALYTSSA